MVNVYRPWMSEFWTVLLALPILVSLIPGGAEIVHRGFVAMSAAPGWYRWSIGAAIALAFGIRGGAAYVQQRSGAPSQQPPAPDAGKETMTNG